MMQKTLREWNAVGLTDGACVGNMIHPEAEQRMSEAQVEWVASRVSAINECFY